MDFKKLVPPYYLTYLHILCGDLLTKTVSIGSLKVNGFIYGKIFKKKYVYILVEIYKNSRFLVILPKYPLTLN